MTAVWVFLGAYFAFHAFQGDNSLGALKALDRQQVVLAAEAAKVAHQRAVLEARTAKLSGKAVDPDMLEEQVRLRLGFVHPDEVVVLVRDQS
ncbi:FtsB family cell division protein [Kordiimonas marina]|uniref:FtsB family cell division protein n=1 Tax=Kordiimonas marina TaxID=2872312 RepID=UPI001FF6519E|nr:septum formation initiator family protein [Kordiimonas marina]MCJ9428779.1 septum formation initiator family protein [Kordiimonas marina]